MLISLFPLGIITCCISLSAASSCVILSRETSSPRSIKHMAFIGTLSLTPSFSRPLQGVPQAYTPSSLSRMTGLAPLMTFTLSPIAFFHSSARVVFPTPFAVAKPTPSPSTLITAVLVRKAL